MLPQKGGVDTECNKYRPLQRTWWTSAPEPSLPQPPRKGELRPRGVAPAPLPPQCRQSGQRPRRGAADDVSTSATGDTRCTLRSSQAAGRRASPRLFRADGSRGHSTAVMSAVGSAAVPRIAAPPAGLPVGLPRAAAHAHSGQNAQNGTACRSAAPCRAATAPARAERGGGREGREGGRLGHQSALAPRRRSATDGGVRRARETDRVKGEAKGSILARALHPAHPDGQSSPSPCPERVGQADAGRLRISPRTACAT